MNRFTCIHQIRMYFVLGLFAVGGTLIVPAQSSVLLFSTSIGVDLVSSGAEVSEGIPYAGLGASGNLRHLLPGDGLLSTSLLADLRYYGGTIGDLQDRYTGALDIRYPVGPVRIETKGEIDASARNLGEGALIIPAWSVDVSYGTSDFTPYTGYYGSYRWSETDTALQAVHGARVGITHDYSLDFGWGTELRGEVSHYPRQFVLDESGESSATERRDRRLDVQLSADGLIGFFHSWDAGAGGGILVSNANRIVSETDGNAVEADSEDRWISYVEGSLQFSPSRSVGFETGVDLHHDGYLHRRHEGSPVRQWGGSGFLRADYTPNGALFFVTDVGGGWDASADPDLVGGYATASFRVEYSF